MAHHRKDPHKTDEFWIEEMNRVLTKNISDGYRKRCEAILADSSKNLAEHKKQNSLHYPRIRS